LSDRYKAVFAGIRKGVDSPQVVQWFKLDAEGKVTDESCSFVVKGKKKTTFNNSWIGDIYEMEETDTNCKIVSLERGRYEDKEKLSEWKLLETAALSEIERDKQAAKLDYENLTLEDLRVLYGRTIGRSRRAALIATIVQYVTK
jgi:hypothetical protein